ncbi:MAG TPA: thermonuclease family protein [Pyrinomonadaceae bacterium]|nr:thermonuclease family protein [Pyrinomonadaceae bacterium]
MKFQRPLATAALSLAICMSVVAQNTVFEARVIQIVDGTTVVVETKSQSQFHVRCLGAAAPPAQATLSATSKQRLSAVLLGETVTIEYNNRNEDGTLLGSIRLKDQNVCLDQVRSGLARVDTETARLLNASDRESSMNAQSIARNNAIGLWAQARTVDAGRYLRQEETIVPRQRTAQDKPENWNSDVNISTPGRRSWLRRNWWIFPTVGALIGGGYLAYRYSSGTGPGIPCVDGSTSHAQNRQGACSHHGGIVK